MAWNPSKEVSAARDAAKALDDAPMCIVFWVSKELRLGMASYGKTKELCRQAKEIADDIMAKMFEDEEA